MLRRTNSGRSAISNKGTFFCFICFGGLGTINQATNTASKPMMANNKNMPSKPIMRYIGAAMTKDKANEIPILPPTIAIAAVLT